MRYFELSKFGIFDAVGLLLSSQTSSHAFFQNVLCVMRWIDRMPMVRDGQSGNWVGTFAGHKGAVWSCKMDPTGSLAATASGDFSARLWDAISGGCLLSLPHKHIVKSCDFSPNSLLLATGGHEGLLRIYPLEELLKGIQQAAKPDAKPPSPAVEPLTIPHVNPTTKNKIVIGKVLWWKDTAVLSGGSDGIIRCWAVPSMSSGEPAAPPSAPTFVLDTQAGAEIRDMEITELPNGGTTVLTVAAGNKVYLYDLNTQSLMAPSPYTMPIHFKEEGGASLHPQGHLLVAGGSDLWVRVFDVATGAELECLKGHHGPIRCLRYAPSGELYASGSEDGTIRLWRTNPEKEG